MQLQSNTHIQMVFNYYSMNICVDENIVKEAITLHYLTVDSNPAGSAICKLLSFFESSNAY